MGYKHGFTHHRYIGNGSKAYAAGFKDGLHDRIVIDGWRERAPRVGSARGKAASDHARLVWSGQKLPPGQA
jgi:hypothetical protein